MMPRQPQNEPCKRMTLSIVPHKPCGLQTPVILTARLLFRVVRINHNLAVLEWRALRHFLYCANNVRCMRRKGGPAHIHHRLWGVWGGDRKGCRAGRQTPHWAFCHSSRLRQRLWWIFIISVRHSIQSICSAGLILIPANIHQDICFYSCRQRG